MFSFPSDSPFQLTNKATGFCLHRIHEICFELQWTSSDRLLVLWRNKCLGAQGKSVGSEVNLYDCDETSELQKWECRNGTLLALKDQELYIELTADSTPVLSKTIGPNNHLTIAGTHSGACTRTYRELYTIGGNANGRVCMFPFQYKDSWYSSCTTEDTADKRKWCSVETKYNNELWGYCPTNSKEHWIKHTTTGDYYQLNTLSALTWSEADASCKQQGASLLSITDPHQHAYITALLKTGGRGQGDTLWTGLVLDPEHSWQWSNGKPYRYLNWDSGHPISNPGHNCAVMNGVVQFSWQSSTCTKKLGYICYFSNVDTSTEVHEAGHCSRPWIPYNGKCFFLNRTEKTWLDAQKMCRKEGGDLVSIRNVEEQSFVISQLGYVSSDELWVGLNDRKTEGLFDWSDHSTVSFTSWEYGKPAIFTDQEDCVLIKGENGYWTDRVCNEKHGFICMKDSASEPTGDEEEQNVGCRTENIYEFQWTNKGTVKFTHWNTAMPGHQQGCVAMKTGIFAGLWDVLNCTNKEKYICKHQAEGASVTPVPPTVPPLKCADEWIQIPTRNYCYKAYSDSLSGKTWYEARDYCRAIGGDLLSIHSQADVQNFHLSFSTFWIGLSAPDPITGYVWSDGSPVNLQHWQDGEPNNKNNAESCAEMKTHWWHETMLWNDEQCEKPNGWLCQIRAGATPKPPPEPVAPDYNVTSEGWLEWQGHTYYINNRAMAMEEARQFCMQKHGDLVTINSEAESMFLWKQISKLHGKYWIGLTVDLDRSFAWMDGSQVVFQKWHEGQPDFQNYDENCAVMDYLTGFWHDYNCGYEHQSICKRDSSPPANATVAPTVAPVGGCPPHWKKFHSKCYSVIKDQRLTWDDGKKQCQAMGGNLASISSRHVEVFLMSQMADTSTSAVWIGLRRLKDAGFYWTDGQPRRYISSSFKRRCVVINTDPAIGIGKWKSTSCNDTNGYVCLRNVDPSLPNSPETNISTDYVRIFNDSIKVVTQPLTWDSAKKHCEDDGAQLTSLRNEWHQAHVELLAFTLKAPLWIGLNKMQTSGYFKFINGRYLSFTRWGPNEPSRDRPCVFLDVDGKWKTAHCNQTMNSACMRTTDADIQPAEPSAFPGVCPEDPNMASTLQEYSWQPFKGYCYMFFTDPRNWADAAASCVRHGGSLASIENPSEQEFIQNHISLFKDRYSAFWIGLYRTHKGEWLWLDKTLMDYTKWSEDEPSDRSHAEIQTSDGTWKSSYSYYKPYICKTAKVIGPIPHEYTALAVVLVALGIAGTVIAFFLFKKYRQHLPISAIPAKLTAFDNPLFFTNNGVSHTNVIDPEKLVVNAENENSETVVTI
ncbi:uncharacterized protein V6R79_014470 [Siganus canaliculatus]